MMPFKVEEELEKNPTATAQECLHDFFQKGGILQTITDLSSVTEPLIQLQVEDAVYPVCSGGWCRSQTLWAVLEPFSEQIILFPPHAARVGWDPYNGQINRYRNYGPENAPDQFSAFFGREKSMRFGFENNAEWKSVETVPTGEGLKRISRFYDRYYYGPHSAWKGKQGKRRIYIAFSHNAHIVLHRLNQSNENLQGVTVIAINSEDVITVPPDFLSVTPRSPEAYAYFSHLLTRLFDFSQLSSIE